MDFHANKLVLDRVVCGRRRFTGKPREGLVQSAPQNDIGIDFLPTIPSLEGHQCELLLVLLVTIQATRFVIGSVVGHHNNDLPW